MTRISEFDTVRSLMMYVSQNREQIAKLGDAISSGIAVREPSDSDDTATIAMTQATLDRISQSSNRVASVKGALTFQENTLDSASTLLIRAQEIAQQAANETNDPTARAAMAAEVYEIRDHMVSLANGTYQGKYVYAGANDSTPPYDTVSVPANKGYANPSTWAGSERYVFAYNAADPTKPLAADLVTRNVQLTDDVSVCTNTPGNKVFDNAIQGLERLGRALEGYETLPATGVPDGTGNKYTFPDDFSKQTKAIEGCLDQLKSAQKTDIAQERDDLAGRLNRLSTADSLMGLSKTASNEILDRLQNTDTVDASTQFSLAQTALQSSIKVISQVLGTSILDYL